MHDIVYQNNIRKKPFMNIPHIITRSTNLLLKIRVFKGLFKHDILQVKL